MTLAGVLPGVLRALGDPGFADPLGLTDVLGGARRAAVLLVDGLGWGLLPRLGLRSFGALKLTCGFPSTTPVSLVSLGTGVASGAHGVVGFNVRVPATGRVLTHIQWGDEPDPARWQPVPTVFERARVPTTVVLPAEFAGSGLTVAAYRGASFRGIPPGSLVPAMLAAVRDTGGLVYGYVGDLDKAGHRFGLTSPEWSAAAGLVDELVGRLVEGLPADAALLVTADHGQLDVPLDGRYDIDTDPLLAAGVVTVAGEARVRYLHVAPGARDDVLAAWRAVLGARAQVLAREEAVAAGWFGPTPAAHLDRIGDVVVACTDDSTVVVASRSEPAFVARMVAFHGSYTAAEQDIPLIVVPAR